MIGANDNSWTKETASSPELYNETASLVDWFLAGTAGLLLLYIACSLTQARPVMMTMMLSATRVTDPKRRRGSKRRNWTASERHPWLAALDPRLSEGDCDEVDVDDDHDDDDDDDRDGRSSITNHGDSHKVVDNYGDHRPLHIASHGDSHKVDDYGHGGDRHSSVTSHGDSHKIVENDRGGDRSFVTLNAGHGSHHRDRDAADRFADCTTDARTPPLPAERIDLEDHLLQLMVERLGCACSVADLVRELCGAESVPVGSDDSCLKITAKDAPDVGPRWLWLTSVNSAPQVALALGDVELVEKTNQLCRVGSDSYYCATFRASHLIRLVRQISPPEARTPAIDNARGGALHSTADTAFHNSAAHYQVAVLEEHFVEHPIDIDDLAALGVGRISAVLRQIMLSLEVYEKLTPLKPAELAGWALSLAVHDEALVEFWLQEELQIAPSHGVVVRLSPTRLFGRGCVQLGDFLHGVMIQVPSLRNNADLTTLTRFVCQATHDSQR